VSSRPSSAEGGTPELEETAMIHALRPANFTMLAAAATLAMTAAAALAADPAAPEPARDRPGVEWDGLQPVRVKGLDQVYVRPGVSLAGYRRIMVDPVEVAFARSWDPNAGTPGLPRVKPSDRERIRADVARLVREQFVRDIEKRGGYPVVEAAGPDVLRVTARIQDLYINAPDTLNGARDRVYVRSAGEMTLVAELRDSETGQLLARAVDRRVDPDSYPLELATSVSNDAAARRAVSAWTRILRDRLDAARAGAANAPASPATPGTLAAPGK
jgi:hypothetical protein